MRLFDKIKEAYTRRMLELDIKEGRKLWGRQPEPKAAVKSKFKVFMEAKVIRADGTPGETIILSEGKEINLTSNDVRALKKAAGKED